MGGVGVGGQEKPSGLDDVTAGGDTGALELIIVVVPELGHPSFSLDPVLRFLGIQVIELALALLPLPALPLLLLLLPPAISDGAVEQNKKTEETREQ
ncbi:hypothetical protein RHMOL_Rhmol01G0350500 [Rhododendron molle]|uniref:Uncharacterized protein n=1 Tax=Rhododendron molle TaxID=49168 RepID=A0ACC0Q8R0_RHOML|nr:hypothetical protein RHMOL_Rhmol01G0350500 [Rhododendron molle]